MRHKGSLHVAGDLQIEQDLNFQKKEWVVQRAGWFIIACLVLMAITGLFGSGFLSQGSIQKENGILYYDKFLRYQTHDDFKIDAFGSQPVKVWVSGEYFDHFEIESITPYPASVKLHENGYLYTFEPAEDVAAVRIKFNLKIESIGFLRGKIKINETAFEFKQFIYP